MTRDDVARAQERHCCTLEIEGWRVPDEVLGELERRGHTIENYGEYEGVFAGAPTRVQLVSVDPLTGERQGASDPRNERGTAV